MPEGDTIHYAARRIRPLVEGLVPEIGQGDDNRITFWCAGCQL